jgi:hypothetical protein
LSLTVEGDDCLTEGVLHVDVFGDFFYLRAFLLSGLLGHKVDLKNDVIPVLGFYYWGIPFLIGNITLQVHLYRIRQILGGLDLLFFNFFILDFLLIFLGLALRVLFHDGRDGGFEGLVHLALVFNRLQT